MGEIEAVAINGRFLGQPLTGVQRFARELTKALDRRITSGDVPAQLKRTRWRLIVPRGTPVDIALQSIEVDPFGGGPGHVWEQTALAFRASGTRLIGFGGSGPLIQRRQVVVIHDATIFRHPESFGRLYRLFHTVLGGVLTRTATVATISQFSRDELGAIFRVPPANLPLIRNAVDHFAALAPDDTILNRLGLADNGFFLIVGTLKPNKNVEFALQAFAALGGSRKMVVVGGVDPKVFKSAARVAQADIIYAGRLDDREIVALQRRATAFVFPSLYEGFGIPPLEAMSQGCPVLAADIPSVREACGNGALYFSPVDLAGLEQAMRTIGTDAALRTDLIARGTENIGRFSWDRSAADLLTILSASGFDRAVMSPPRG